MSAARQPLVHLGLVLAAVAAVYVNTLDNGFHFDDEHSLLGNPSIRSLAAWPRFFADPQAFSRNVGSEMYRPLVLVSYALNYRLGRYDARGYHAVNLALHLGVAALLYGVLAQLEAPRTWALLGALWAAVHPLAAEPVNYVSSRSESMAALFCLAGLILYARSPARHSAGAVICFAAGLLSKPVAAGFPLLLLGYEWAYRSVRLRSCWRRQWPYWLVLAGYLALTQRLVREAVVGAPVRGWAAQLSTQAKGLVYYLKLVALPRPLTVEHQFAVSAVPWAPVVLASLLLLGSLAGLALSCRRMDRRPAFWSVWALVALGPTLVVPLNVLVAERRVYPALGAAAGLMLWALRRQHRTAAVSALGGAWLLALAAITVGYNRDWQSEARLWSRALHASPLMVRPHLRMGTLYRAAGEWDRCEAEYRAALALDSTCAPAYNNLGNLYVQTGRHDEAEASLAKALALLPGYPEAMVNLATLRAGQGRLEEALALFAQAIPLSPNRAEAYNNQGTALLRAGRYAEAEKALRRAVELDPGAAAAQSNLAGALEGLGRDAEALEAFGKAVELDPGYAKPYYHLGLLYEKAGRTAEAAKAYKRFLERWDGDPRVAAQVRQQRERLEGGR